MNASIPTTAQSGDLLLCLSHLRWNFVFQRPHHLLTRASRSFQVVFLEEPVFEPNAVPTIRLTACDGVLVATPVLPEGAPDPAALVRAELGRLLGGFDYKRLLLWYYSPMAQAFAQELEPDLVVYDCMDELSAFRFAPPDLVAREQQLLDRADIVFTGGVSLYESKRSRHRNVHCFPSSIDAGHFGRARRPIEDPADQRAIAHPRIGYFGVIDERLDLGLLDALATTRPDWQLVMIGPLAKISESDLPHRDNIHWLGAKDYKVLPDYLAGWDVGLMPFALNEATRFISPTKTPEFLAAGLPVASTPIADVVNGYGKSGLVAIAEGAEAMIEAIERLRTSPRDDFIVKVDAALSRMSWDSTWEAMLDHVERGFSRADETSRAAIRAKDAVHV